MFSFIGLTISRGFKGCDTISFSVQSVVFIVLINMDDEREVECIFVMSVIVSPIFPYQFESFSCHFSMEIRILQGQLSLNSLLGILYASDYARHFRTLLKHSFQLISCFAVQLRQLLSSLLEGGLSIIYCDFSSHGYQSNVLYFEGRYRLSFIYKLLS